MRKKCVFGFVVGTVCLLGTVIPGRAQLQPHGPKTLEKATNVLNAFMNMRDQRVSRSILQRAQGLVIVPEMVNLKAAAHGSRGKGIVVARNEEGRWHPPSFVTMSGDMVDVQGHGEPIDIILVFNTRESVRELYRGKFQVGVDAVAGAGPVGRESENGAEDQEKVELYSYSRGGGSFSGTPIDGCVITVDAVASRDYYQAAAKSPDGKPTVSNPQLPLPAAQFLAALKTYNHADTGSSRSASVEMASEGNDLASVTPTGSSSNQAGGSTATTPNSGAAANDTSVSGTEAAPDDDAPLDSLETTRQQLATAARNLGGLLDESWRQYLALPQGVFSGEGVPTIESLQRSLRRFETVTDESKYRVLLQREEFQEAYQTLRRYYERVEAAGPSGTGSSSVTATEEGGRPETR